MVRMQDIAWMRYALVLAERGAGLGEVPVGAVLVLDNQIIGQGWNCPITRCDPTAHAELVALRAGARTLNNYRLLNTTLYVTLEPCPMCMGALVHARIQRLVFGAAKYEHAPKVNHEFVCEGGVLLVENTQLLQDFFIQRRK
jgi:tRNA(adenine34) deaminase